MRSNFRPNIRLVTNILLVFGTFAIALKITPIAKVYNKKIYVLNIKTSNRSRQTYQKTKNS